VHVREGLDYLQYVVVERCFEPNLAFGAVVADVPVRRRSNTRLKDTVRKMPQHLPDISCRQDGRIGTDPTSPCAGRELLLGENGESAARRDLREGLGHVPTMRR
jgi:hypothetical protein